MGEESGKRVDLIKTGVVWFLNVLASNQAIIADGSQDRRLTIVRATTQRQSGETMTSVSAGHIKLF